MKDWRELFSDDALIDGWELYLDGKVENLEVNEEDDGKFTELSAVVYGEEPETFEAEQEDDETEEFEVFAQIEDDAIIDIDCDCREAVEGAFCRHMAAMFYEYEDVYGTVWDKDRE